MTLTPIQNTNFALKSIFRYVLPLTRTKINQSTYEKHKSVLMANKSVIFKDEVGRIWLLGEKSKSCSSNYLVRLRFEVLFQGEAEKIAARLNGNKFCHAYFDNSIVYSMDELHEVTAYGEKAFLCLRLNKGKITSFSWNYTMNNCL